MSTIGYIVTITAIATNAFSGVCAILRLKLVRNAMARVDVPESWIVFPIGTAKVAGAIGLLLGMLGVPVIGQAAAIGLIVYWSLAVMAHLRVRDYSGVGAPGGFFLPLAMGALVVGAW